MSSDAQLTNFIGPLLDALAAPRTSRNQTGVRLWAASEGVADRHHNPLATSYDGFGGVSYNGDGVKTYPTIGAGVKATAATIKLPAYRAVLAALRGDEGYSALWTAVHESPWCSGCQGGKYPEQLRLLAGFSTGPVAQANLSPRAEANDETWSKTVSATARGIGAHADTITHGLRALRGLTS